MTTKNPLSYPSQKVVLANLEANLRLNLVKRCPFLRTPDNATPLQIDYLEFGASKVVINKTEYIVGLYRSYPSGFKIPRIVLNENSAGGVPYDVDEHGSEDKTVKTVLNPGDIKWNPNGRHHTVLPIEAVEQRLADLEIVLAGTKENSSYRDHIEQQIENLQFLKLTSEPLPYKFLLQLTIRSQERTSVQLSEPNVKLYEALHLLTTKLLGNRQGPIIVRQLKVLDEAKVLRLPPDVKFRIQGLTVIGNIPNIYRKLEPIVLESSYPLKRFEFGNMYSNNLKLEFQNPIFAENELLVLSDKFKDSPTIEQLKMFENQKIYVRSYHKYWLNDLIILIEHWKLGSKEVGANYTFGMNREVMADSFRRIRNHFEVEGIKIENGNLIIPTQKTCRIRVSRIVYTRLVQPECELCIEVIE